VSRVRSERGQATRTVCASPQRESTMSFPARYARTLEARGKGACRRGGVFALYKKANRLTMRIVMAATGGTLGRDSLPRVRVWAGAIKTGVKKRVRLLYLACINQREIISSLSACHAAIY